MVEKLERSKEMEGDGTGVGVWRQSWGLSAMVMVSCERVGRELVREC